MARFDADTGRARGREASRVRDIPRPGWRDVAVRVRSEIKKDRLGLIAAGVAFYGFLAIFPALAALISIWGLFADPAQVQREIAALDALPQAARELIGRAATRIAATSPTSLGWSTAISVALALWSANKGMKGLVAGVTVAYDEEDTRGFFRSNALTLALTLGATALAIVALGVVVVVPPALDAVGLGGAAGWAIRILRWPLLAALVLVALGVIYRAAAPRQAPRWRWVTPGAVLAVALWLVASIGFSVYAANFGSYDQVYGSLAAVAILLVWFYLGAFIVLLGAEVNAEMELETMRDTTTGPAKPMGERGAYVADHIA